MNIRIQVCHTWRHYRRLSTQTTPRYFRDSNPYNGALSGWQELSLKPKYQYTPPNSDRLIYPSQNARSAHLSIDATKSTNQLAMFGLFRCPCLGLTDASKCRPIRTGRFIQDGNPHRSPNDATRTHRCVNENNTINIRIGSKILILKGICRFKNLVVA